MQYTLQPFGFLRLLKITLVFLYLLVVVGSVVRATGSGMGCPDWPTCFGKVIPPTHVNQLPPNYKEVFKTAHHEIADFNALHTWVEYINRLLGVLVGMFVLATFLFSLRFIRSFPIIAGLAFLTLILTGLEGVIGKYVVDSNLKPVMVTLHMVVALLIIAIFIYLKYFTEKHLCNLTVNVQTRIPAWLMIAAALLTLVQVVLGTQVREQVDHLVANYSNLHRNTYVSELGVAFKYHAVLAWLVVIVNALFALLLLNNKPLVTSQVKFFAWGLILVVVAEFLVGTFLSRMGIPAFLQPIHLLLASILFGLQVAILFRITGRQLSN